MPVNWQSFSHIFGWYVTVISFDTVVNKNVPILKIIKPLFILTITIICSNNKCHSMHTSSHIHACKFYLKIIARLIVRLIEINIENAVAQKFNLWCGKQTWYENSI